jgi:hypothetical protein
MPTKGLSGLPAVPPSPEIPRRRGPHIPLAIQDEYLGYGREFVGWAMNILSAPV